VSVTQRRIHFYHIPKWEDWKDDGWFLTVSRNRSVLFFRRPRSEGWPHHGRTFSIYVCPLSFWLTLPRGVPSTCWCCPPETVKYCSSQYAREKLKVLFEPFCPVDTVLLFTVFTEWWGAGVVICLEQRADLHTAQLMPLPLTVSCFSKSRLVLRTFWYRLTRVVPDKGPLDVCVCNSKKII